MTLKNKQVKILYFILLIVVLVLGCKPSTETGDANEMNLQKIKKLADAYVDLTFKYFPENYVYYSSGQLDHGGLSDNSQAGTEQWDFILDSLYSEFEEITVNHEVGSESWYLYGYLKEALEAARQLRICKLEYNTINHLSGWQIYFQQVASQQPVGNEKARKDAFRRWKQLPRFVDNEIDNLRRGVSEGYTVPKRIVKLVIDQISDMLTEPVAESGFYSPAKRDTSDAFKKGWQDVVTGIIYPSLKKYRDFLSTEYYKSARESISLADLPNGKEAYEAYYRYHTSVSRTVDDIIEVSEYNLRVSDSKLRLYGQEKYGSNNIPDILKNIIRDTGNYFNSREEMLFFAKETVKRARQKCKITFGQVPKQNLEVVPISEKLQESMTSHYIPSIDSIGRPSYYYINLRHPEKKMRSELETEIFHETLPGHHLQLGLVGERDSTHLLVKLFSVGGYIEGWASYAQVLADEMGLYSTGYSHFLVSGRSSRIMYLEAMIHSGKWTADDAVKYLTEYGSYSPEVAETVIDRLIVWPGQYSTYDTGLVEFLELREKAMLTLGDDFDIKEFHRIVLEGGAIPLEMLREKVNWWLEKKTEKKADK